MASETFAGLLSFKESGWWISPTGESLATDYHAGDAADLLSIPFPKDYDDNYVVADEFDQKMIDRAIASGWIRVDDDWDITVQVQRWTNKEKNLLYDFLTKKVKFSDTTDVSIYAHGSSGVNREVWTGTVGDIKHKFFVESAFTNLISLHEGGYWIEPTGRIIPTDDHGAEAVEILGLEYPEGNGDKYDSEIVAEFESEAVYKALERGWVRVEDENFSYTIQVLRWGKREKELVYDFFKDHGNLSTEVAVWIDGGNSYKNLPVWSGTVGEIRHKFFGESESRELGFVSLLEQVRVPVTGIWWLNSRSAKVVSVEQEHAETVAEDPQAFGLTEEQVEAEDTNQGVLRLAYERGWIRGISNSARVYLSGYKSPSTLNTIVELAAGVRPEVELVIDWDNGAAQPAAIYRNKFLSGARSYEFLAGDVVKDSSILESRMRLQEDPGRWWLNPKGKLIDTGGEEHATYAVRNPLKFSLSADMFDRDIDWDRAEDEEISVVWKSVISDRKWVRVAKYSFGWNLTVPDLTQSTKDRIWDWAKKPARFDYDPQNVWIDVFAGRFQVGRVGNHTTIERIVKNFDFGDGVHEGFKELVESALTEGQGYWLTDKGDLAVGDDSREDWGDLADSHTSYLRKNKLFSGDRYSVALRKGWIAARNVYGDHWSMIVYKLDSRAKDRIWDFASQRGNQGDSVSIYTNRGAPAETTFERITKDFDFGDGAQESQMAPTVGSWRLNTSAFFTLLEDLGSSVEEGAHDQIYRQEAIKAWEYLNRELEENQDKVMLAFGRGGVTIPKYPELSVYAIFPFQINNPGVAGTFKVADTVQGGRPSIMIVLPFAKFPSLSGAAKSQVRETFIHEFIHYLDSKRSPTVGKPAYWEGDEGQVRLNLSGYYNNPEEFNAMYQSAVSSLERRITLGEPLEWTMASPQRFAAGVLNVLDYVYPRYAEMITSDLRQKIMKRAAMDYPRVLALSKEKLGDG